MKLLVVPGDGIGPEITKATLTAVEALKERFGLDLTLEYASCGQESLRQFGTTIRDEDMASAREADGVILGPMSVKEYPSVRDGGVNVPAAFRTQLDLHANIRPSYTRKGVASVAKQMDLVFARESLEDFYIDRNMYQGIGEVMPTEDVVLAIGKITARGSRKIAITAFELARRRRRKVTVVHKSPVLKMYNGVFVKQALEVAASYPDVSVDDMMVDAAAALLIRTPERFDVILTTNMFGDILSDEASELAGSLGLAASINHGDVHAVAQAGHGSAPDIAGQDLANPASLMLSTAMLFEHLGAKSGENSLVSAGAALRTAVDDQIANVATRTRDLGGPLGTAAFAARVAQSIRSLTDHSS